MEGDCVVVDEGGVVVNGKVNVPSSSEWFSKKKVNMAKSEK